jgi:ribosome-binding factor A
MAALRRAAGRLAGRLTREMNLKYAPKLHFVPDELFDHAARMERMLSDERGRINPANADSDTVEEDADAGA